MSPCLCKSTIDALTRFKHVGCWGELFCYKDNKQNFTEYNLIQLITTKLILCIFKYTFLIDSLFGQHWMSCMYLIKKNRLIRAICSRSEEHGACWSFWFIIRVIRLEISTTGCTVCSLERTGSESFVWESDCSGCAVCFDSLRIRLLCARWMFHLKQPSL